MNSETTMTGTEESVLDFFVSLAVSVITSSLIGWVALGLATRLAWGHYIWISLLALIMSADGSRQILRNLFGPAAIQRSREQTSKMRAGWAYGIWIGLLMIQLSMTIPIKNRLGWNIPLLIIAVLNIWTTIDRYMERRKSRK